MLFKMNEIQAILALLNRTPMTPAEQLFAAGFFQRLAAFCQPPKPEGPKLTEEQAQAMADALAIADALDSVTEAEAPAGETETEETE